jgi:signal transduction histidine kinase
MKKRNLVFLALSLFIAVSDALFVAINNLSSADAFEKTLDQEGQQLHAAFDTLLSQTYANMLTMAVFIANDAAVQQTFLKGVKAVREEGGGTGGPKAAQAREELFELVGPNWQRVQERFDARQLHFHMGPGSTSFIRIHNPKTFGDFMDIRYMIHDTNRDARTRTGFETGRVYAGLRGVVPVMAKENDGSVVQAGALEVGTSFNTQLGILDKRYGQGLGVLLDLKHVRGAMWPDYIKKRFGDGLGGCDCVIEAASRDGLEPIIDAGVQAGLDFRRTGTSIVEVDGKHMALTRFPLRDYQGSVDPARPDVGTIVFWRDASAQVAAHRRGQWFNILYGVVGFAIIELLLMAAFRAVARHLEAEIEAKTAELARSNRELAHFSYVVSHDLKEPLRTVGSYLTLLERRYKGKVLDDTAGEYISFAVDGAKRMTAMIEGLLDYSRVHSKGLNPIPTDTGECLREALVNLETAIAEARAAIHVEGSLPKVPADPGQLVRVFQNLVGNAIKYRAPDRPPEIRLSAERQGSFWLFRVADNGIGIAPEHHESVFKVFSRLHTREEYEGTGIGLAITQKIVERHGGRIRVESGAGKGSTFLFTLPAGPSR